MGTLIGRHKLSFGDPLHSKNLSLCDLQEFHHQEPQAIDGHHETWTVHHVWEDGSQEGDDEGTWSESDEGGEVEGDDSMDLGSDGIGDDFQEVERPDLTPLHMMTVLWHRKLAFTLVVASHCASLNSKMPHQ